MYNIIYCILNPSFVACGKVALLIGIKNYQTYKELPAARSDIYLFQKVLTDMDFKVVSLLDLNKNEMFNAIDTFCSLLNKGVYGEYL